MATENTGGTQSATVSTEHTLATITSGGTFVLAVDVSNLANGDELELRAVVKARSGSTAKTVYLAGFAHAQADDVAFSVPVPAPHSVAFTLKQIAGTARSFEWAVYEL